MTDAEYRQKEIVDVRMSREDFHTMQKMIDERRAYDVITGRLKSLWMWVVVGGVLSIISLWDVIKVKVGS